MVVRARSFLTEGFTGAGRTLLWRDSLKMAPDFVITGCGPEGFRKAFLAYKSKELARFAPDNNNESSHNSYLDASISFGLPGAGLFATIIVSTFSLLSGARRRVNQRRRVIITGLLSSFAAVTVHNFFIFDQVPTGLYFFSVLALACAAANVEERNDEHNDERHPSELNRKKDARLASVPRKKTAVCVIVVSGVVSLVLASYSFLAMNADKQLNKAFVAADQGDLDQVLSGVNSATSYFDPAGDRAFVAARALTLCAEK